MKTLEKMVNLMTAIENCKKPNNLEWLRNHEESLGDIIKNGPSGSGIDCGTKLLSYSPKQIVFLAEFHHMNDVGYYDGWTSHKIILTPAFCGYDMKITGRDRNDIKEYLGDVYSQWLDEEVGE